MLLAQKLDLTDEQIKVSTASVELTAISRPWLCSGILVTIYGLTNGLHLLY